MNDTPNQRVPRLAWLPRLLCLALGLYVASVCWRIELLNAEAEYYLPRRDLREGENPRWRVSLVVDEESWIQHVRSTHKGEVDHSPLTPEEFKKMVADTKQWKAWNNLRGVVSQQGLAQYPIAMLTAAWSAYLFRKRLDWRLRAVAGSAFALALISLGLALYRGYFTSLGW